jgi:hypothetical protein
MESDEIALLRVKLEASELRHEVRELRSVVAQYQRELRESNRLLLKQRLPPRPHTNSTEKQLIAASQQWRCAGGGECPLKKLTPGGVFDQSLYIIDHSSPWSASGRHVGNRRALCVWCDSVKTRREVAEGKHRPVESSDEESEG